MFNYTSDLNLPSFEQVLEDADDKKALILHSGGLDSGYILWKYTKTATSDTIYTHHMTMYPTTRSTVKAENIASALQREWLESTFSKEIIVFNTSFSCDKKTFTAVRDWYLVLLVSLEYAMANNLSYIITGDCISTDYIRRLKKSKHDTKRFNELSALRDFVKSYTNNTVELCIGMDTVVGDAYDELPDDYIKYLFSCRNPRFEEQYVIRCERCEACTKNKSFNWHNKLPTTLKLER